MSWICLMCSHNKLFFIKKQLNNESGKMQFELLMVNVCEEALFQVLSNRHAIFIQLIELIFSTFSLLCWFFINRLGEQHGSENYKWETVVYRNRQCVFGLIVINFVLVVIIQDGVCEPAGRWGLSLHCVPRVVPGCGGLWRCGNCGCCCWG